MLRITIYTPSISSLERPVYLIMSLMGILSASIFFACVKWSSLRTFSSSVLHHKILRASGGVSSSVTVRLSKGKLLLL